MNDGSCSRIQGGWRELREREEVGTENPKALYTHSQLGGRQYCSHLLVPFCCLLVLVILIRFHPIKNIKGWGVRTARHCVGCSECSMIKNAIWVQPVLEFAYKTKWRGKEVYGTDTGVIEMTSLTLCK